MQSWYDKCVFCFGRRWDETRRRRLLLVKRFKCDTRNNVVSILRDILVIIFLRFCCLHFLFTFSASFVPFRLVLQHMCGIIKLLRPARRAKLWASELGKILPLCLYRRNYKLNSIFRFRAVAYGLSITANSLPVSFLTTNYNASCSALTTIVCDKQILVLAGVMCMCLCWSLCWLGHFRFFCLNWHYSEVIVCARESMRTKV